jgi:hypothetical protein
MVNKMVKDLLSNPIKSLQNKVFLIKATNHEVEIKGSHLLV